jgi:DNA-directed RNA polymerase subunit M/transcription elongation factor TFIIS
MSTIQIAQIRQAVMTEPPGSAFWESPFCLAYIERQDAGFKEMFGPLAGLRVYFTRNPDGTWHWHACSRADAWTPIRSMRQSYEELDGDFQAGRCLVNCPECEAAVSIRQRWHEEREFEREQWEQELRIKAAVQADRDAIREKTALARMVECPACGQPAGRNCRSSGDKPTKQAHASRIQAAQQAA